MLDGLTSIYNFKKKLFGRNAYLYIEYDIVKSLNMTCNRVLQKSKKRLVHGHKSTILKSIQKRYS